MNSLITYEVTVYPDGSKHWYQNGKRHREDGPAVDSTSGYKEWWVNDKLHRENGPAIEWTNGDKCWYLNDELHREDGPAIEDANGNKYWYRNGEHLSYSEWKREVAKLNQPSCNGKVVEIEGKKYQLTEVE